MTEVDSDRPEQTLQELLDSLNRPGLTDEEFRDGINRAKEKLLVGLKAGAFRELITVVLNGRDTEEDQQ